MDELIATANIAHFRQLLREAKITGAERDDVLQRLAREEAKLFARSIKSAGSLRA